MKTKKQNPIQKKVSEIMDDFKEGELHDNKTDALVTNPLEAIALAYGEAEQLKKP